MATLSSGPIDPEILAKIIKEKEELKPKSKESKPDIKELRTLVDNGSGKKFSDFFWEPEFIPDVPVASYQPEDWDEEARVVIPDVNPYWIWPRKATELFALAMYSNDTTLMYGLQGTGKSDLVAQWGALLNIPVWRMNCHTWTREEHFVGSVSVAYEEDASGETRMRVKQEPSILTDSLKFGGIFLEDEAFRHSSALVLQSLREKNTRKLVLPDAPGRTSEERILKADPDRWRYVLTDNTTGSGDHTGMFQAEVQDASTLDRITFAIEVDYLPKDGEKEILKKFAPELSVSLINKMIRFANIIRGHFRNNEMQATMSVRGLLAWAEKCALIGKPALALNMSWASKLTEENYVKAVDAYHQVFGEKLDG